MTMEQIINLDCSEDTEEERNKVIQQYLRKIKPLAKYKMIEDVPFYKIEKVITVLSKKYNIRIGELIPDVWSNDKETIWKAVLVNDNRAYFNTLSVIYGLSLYEVFAKTAIYMYSIKEKVGERRER